MVIKTLNNKVDSLFQYIDTLSKKDKKTRIKVNIILGLIITITACSVILLMYILTVKYGIPLVLA